MHVQNVATCVWFVTRQRMDEYRIEYRIDFLYKNQFSIGVNWANEILNLNFIGEKWIVQQETFHELLNFLDEYRSIFFSDYHFFFIKFKESFFFFFFFVIIKCYLKIHLFHLYPKTNDIKYCVKYFLIIEARTLWI